MKNTSPTIAIVENDFAMRRALERLLQASGYIAEAFTSAEHFLGRASNACIACLLLDIDLNGMSGLQLQKMLMSMDSAPPIIFITGQRDEPTVTTALDMGCIAYLHKPFEARHLLQAIDTALGPSPQNALAPT